MIGDGGRNTFSVYHPARDRRVVPDGRILNRELVAAGLAWHYTRYSKDEDLARLERKAREARVGLWSEERTVAPWDYRAAARGAGR